MENKKRYKNLIKQGVDERESGGEKKNIKDSIEIFEQAKKEASTWKERLDCDNHIGICHYLLGEYEKALKLFAFTANQARKWVERNDPDDSFLAVCLRHTSRPELHEKKNLSKALGIAREAHELAKRAKRNDLPWFTDGILKNLIALKASKKEMNDVWEMGLKELNDIWLEEKSDKAKWGWLVGLQVHKALIENDESFLNMANLSAVSFNLERRKEQIEKTRKEIAKKKN